jgi:hypothetical protein
MKLLGLDLICKDGYYEFRSKYKELNSYFSFDINNDFVRYLYVPIGLGVCMQYYVKSSDPSVILQIMSKKIADRIVKQQFEELFKKELIFL